MARVIRVQKGGVVPIRTTYREIRSDAADGQLLQPNGATLVILNPDGTTQSTLAMTPESTARLVAYWDTSALAVGDYLTRVRYGYAYASSQAGTTKAGARAVVLRLVNAV